MALRRGKGGERVLDSRSSSDLRRAGSRVATTVGRGTAFVLLCNHMSISN